MKLKKIISLLTTMMVAAAPICSTSYVNATLDSDSSYMVNVSSAEENLAGTIITATLSVNDEEEIVMSPDDIVMSENDTLKFDIQFPKDYSQGVYIDIDDRNILADTFQSDTTKKAILPGETYITVNVYDRSGSVSKEAVFKVTVKFDDSLSVSQRQSLTNLWNKMAPICRPFCYHKYSRQEKIIRGEIPEDTPRISMEKINELIENANKMDIMTGPEYIMEQISLLYPVPDYSYSCDFSYSDYWIDKFGREKIRVYSDSGNLLYLSCDRNGNTGEYIDIYPYYRTYDGYKAPKDLEYLLYNEISPQFADAESGDLNTDGTIDSKDILVLKNWILNNGEIKLNNWLTADLNEDDKVNIADYCLLKEMLIK